ncbi:MAG: alpha/beta fold hydrolase [Chloroflexi bacterium]|nr:alpha/beta fold hydrolase [Chloroflexota bacterium]
MNDRPGLLLVHAFPVDATIWQAQVASLATPGQTVVAPSLPGFGGTPVPPRQPSIDDYADALVKHLDEAGVKRAVVCGLSMGGYVTFALWRRHRSRIAGLVLADTKAEEDNEQGKAGRAALAAKLREVGPEQAFFSATPPPWLRAESPHWAMLKATILRQPAEAIAQAALVMQGRPDSRADLPSIDVPTAVIVGEADPITPVANSQALVDGIKGATLTVVKDAGHLVNVEQPAAFDAAVKALLARVKS